MPSSPLTIRERLILALLLTLTIIAYWPGLSGGFVFDDFGNLVDNTAFAPDAIHAHFWGSVWSSGSGPTDRPISMLTFAIQAWFTGLAPWPLKLVNVLIHLSNGLLVFYLSRSVFSFVYDKLSQGNWLTSPNALALFVTGAWLLTPIQLTAVLYVIQRMESLSAFFVMAGLGLYWQGRMRLMSGQNGGWWLILSGLIGGTVLAVFAKESGVMLPVYAFLLEWLILRGRTAWGFDPRFIWLYIFVLFLPAIAGLMYTLPSVLNGSAYAPRPFDLAQRLLTEGRVMIDYLHWIIAPSPNALSLYHDDIPLSTGWLNPWTTLASWIVIIGLIGSAVWLKNKAPLFALGVLWFFAGQSLVSTYIPLELVYEHRNYLPSWGIFIALFGLIFTREPEALPKRATIRTLAIVGVSALIALYGGFTALRAQTWGNPYRLAYFEATTHPESPRSNYDLARFMMITSSGPDSASFRMGMKGMEHTSELPGASLQADQALIFMAAKNRIPVKPSWWVSIRMKMARQPISTEDIGALFSLINCGINSVCHYSPEDISQLGKTLAFAVQLHPKSAGLLTLYANYSANITHDYTHAYKLAQTVVALSPKNSEYWKNLITLQTAAGFFSDAQHGIERMSELNSIGINDPTIVELQRTLSEKEASANTQRKGQ